MKKLSIISFVILLFGSCYYNAADRNKIAFKDRLEDVQRAIIKISPLIKKIPRGKDYQTNYEFRNDTLIVNNGPGRDDSTSYHTKEALSNLSGDESKEFIRLAQYLKDNFLVAGYIPYDLKICFFEYRPTPQNTYDDGRDVSVLNDYVNNPIQKEYKIIDQKGSLILLANRDAKIYNNYTLVDDGKAK